jgi:hypothetical protein
MDPMMNGALLLGERLREKKGRLLFRFGLEIPMLPGS